MHVYGKARLGEKLAYIRRRWGELLTFLQDCRVEFDSNAVESLICRIALTGKCAVFARHDEGRRTWGFNASLIATAKINGVYVLPTEQRHS